ncbi:hypothetical protein GOBAR_AA34374 [Gossypium barbadense]|uniref:Uncharacterized protein n=1 Tax=Gossypium barbadense TaxID=3634 RepID=A0A2P5W5H5_GOSBA|nr:hypothetical protein GOBAR_AA34374 [Gossypium barbadense]
MEMHESDMVLRQFRFRQSIHWHPRSGEVCPLSTSMQELILMAAPPPEFVSEPPSPTYYMSMSSTFHTTMMLMMTYTPSIFGASTGVQSLCYRCEEDERPRPQPIPEVEPRRNSARNCRPPRCGTHSSRGLD